MAIAWGRGSSRAGAGKAMAYRVQVEDRPGIGISVIAIGIPAGVSSKHAYLGRAARAGARDDNTEVLRYIAAGAECIRIR